MYELTPKQNYEEDKKSQLSAVDGEWLPQCISFPSITVNSFYNTYARALFSAHLDSFLTNLNVTFPLKITIKRFQVTTFNWLEHDTTQNLFTSYIFSQIEELHDARRVYSHGQEEDHLRSALNMVIDRVVQIGEPFLVSIDSFYIYKILPFFFLFL